MNIQISPDTEIVSRARSGSRTAFEELVRRYQGKSMRLALGMLNNREDAEEAVQDAFVRAYRSLNAFREDARFSTWLYRILVNVCRSRRRRKQNTVDVSAVEDRYDRRLLRNDGEEFSGGTIAPKMMSEYVEDALNSLSTRYRSVISLFYMEEFTVSEIAHILMISESSVKVRLYRGRMQLKEIMTRKLGEKVKE